MKIRKIPEGSKLLYSILYFPITNPKRICVKAVVKLPTAIVKAE